MSRVLDCTRCGDPVRVFEVPREHLDPDTYVCGDHLRPVEQRDDDREPQVGPFQIPERARAAA